MRKHNRAMLSGGLKQTRREGRIIGWCLALIVALWLAGFYG